MKKYFTREDDIVKDSLRCVSELQGNLDPLVIITGGMACQLYTPWSRHYRPTNDIDTQAARYVPKSEFSRSIGPYMSELMSSLGYSIDLNKCRCSYEAKVRRGKGINGKEFCIHVRKTTRRSWRRFPHWMNREMEQALQFKFPRIGGRLWLMRLEDVIANKMARLFNLRDKGILSPEEERVLELASRGNFGYLSKK